MNFFELPTDLVRNVYSMLGDPCTYFYLRASCRAGARMMPAKMAVSLTTFTILQKQYSYRIGAPRDKMLRISDLLSDSTARHVIVHQSLYQIGKFFARYRPDEIRTSLSMKTIRYCLDFCCDKNVISACAVLIPARNDFSYIKEVCLERELRREHFEIVDIIRKAGIPLMRHSVVPPQSLLASLTKEPFTINQFIYLLSCGVPIQEVNLMEFFDKPILCDIDIVVLLLSTHSIPITKCSHRATLLATKRDDLELLELLVAYSAPIEPRQCMANARSIEMAQYLAKTFNTDINVKYAGKSVARNMCTDPNYVWRLPEFLKVEGVRISKYMIARAFRTLVFSTSSAMCLTVVERLVETGVDVNAASRTTRRTLLHHAARHPRSEKLIEWLVRCVPDLHMDAVDRDGVTPLMLACGYSTSTVVATLLERGANPQLQDSAGQTAMHYSLFRDDEPMIAEYLVKYGALDGQAESESKRRRAAYE